MICKLLFYGVIFILSMLLIPENLAQHAYVTNDSSVSVINTATNTVEKIIALPNDNYPDIDLTPDGKFAYIAVHSLSARVTVISTITNSVYTNIPIPDGVPHGVAITPDGKYAYITCFGTEIIAVIDIATNTLIDKFALPGVGNVHGIAITPDGNTAYITRRYAKSVSVVDLSGKSLIASIPVGMEPLEATISPDGNYVYVGNTYENTVSVISTASNSVVATIPVGSFPVMVCFNNDGDIAFVANLLGSSISVINTLTFEVTSTIPIENGSPRHISFTRDGHYAYVANSYSQSHCVTVINAESNTVIATIDIPGHPLAIAVSQFSLPSAITETAEDIRVSSAALNGIVNPGYSATTIYFEWGEDSMLASFKTTGSQMIGPGVTDTAVSANINELKANTTFYYRLVAENIFGTVRGNILCFRTLTIQQGIELIIALVNEDFATGKLRRCIGNALNAQLNAALIRINKNHFLSATLQLKAFIYQVSSLKRIKMISEPDGDLLIMLAKEIAEQLSDMDKISSDIPLPPSDYELAQNYPNPFNPITRIRFGIPDEGKVTLKIYNSTGELVKTLIDGILPGGIYETQWKSDNDNGIKVASGIYFYRLTAVNSKNNFSKVNKMILLK